MVPVVVGPSCVPGAAREYEVGSMRLWFPVPICNELKYAVPVLEVFDAE